MSHFLFRLYDDFFTLLDPTGNPFGDPRFRGMRVPQRVRNVILQAQDDIIAPRTSSRCISTTGSCSSSWPNTA
jgi:hypothetical protein